MSKNIIKFNLINGTIPDFVKTGGRYPYQNSNGIIELLGEASGLPEHKDLYTVLTFQEIVEHLNNVSSVFYETDPMTNIQKEISVNSVANSILN
jgi:hypothetical protein